MEQLASWRTRKRPRPGHKPPSQAPDTPDCCVPLQLAAGFSPAPILVFQIWATYIAGNSFSPLGQPNGKKKKGREFCSGGHDSNYHLSPGADPGKPDPEWDWVARLGELSFHLWPAASATSLAPPGRIQQLTGQAPVALSPASTRQPSLCSLWEFPCGFSERASCSTEGLSVTAAGNKIQPLLGLDPEKFLSGELWLDGALV